MTYISIIVPCYNEESTITKLLEAIAAQTWSRADMEVVIADGLSEDRTREMIAAFADFHPDLHIMVIDNPRRIIPAALNYAMRSARGDIIIRLDGHSRPYPDYVERCATALQAGFGENVGGSWEIHPGSASWIAAGIALAAAHPLGSGDALYRHGSKPAKVDTVPFGAFGRELLATIGFFNESLLTNEDYEYNARIRRAGGTIWFDPAIRSVYFARSTYRELAQQYWRYGYWKWQMLRNFPGTLRWRQALPPLFVLGLILGLAVSLFIPIFWIPYLAAISLYAIILLASGVQTAIRHARFSHLLAVPLAVLIMHICWGSSFLWSMIGGNRTKKTLQSGK